MLIECLLCSRHCARCWGWNLGAENLVKGEQVSGGLCMKLSSVKLKVESNKETLTHSRCSVIICWIGEAMNEWPDLVLGGFFEEGVFGKGLRHGWDQWGGDGGVESGIRGEQHLPSWRSRDSAFGQQDLQVLDFIPVASKAFLSYCHPYSVLLLFEAV